MSHIAMVSVPAHGHVNPSLAVIAELVARGHRVSYAMDEAFGPVVTATGAELVPYRSTLPVESDPTQSWPDDPGAAQHRFLADNESMLPQLAAALDGDRPDLLLYDIGAYAARVLAHHWSRPIVQISPAMVAWEGFQQDMAPVLDAIAASPTGAAYLAAFRAWLDREGIELSVDEFAGRPERCIATVPRALQPNADRVDGDRYTFVGPCLDPRSHQDSWAGPGDGRPVLLVSFGSAYTDQLPVYRAAIEGFAADWHVVLSVGKHVDPADLGPLPLSVEAHRWVPQLAVLARASAFVTHAGMGGCSEGLMRGVPMVAVPQAVDQFGNAERLVELGVGRSLDTAAAGDPVVLRAAVDSLVGDPAVATGLAALSEQAHAEGGTRRAADLIEAELAR